jgi:hypothetical protein
MIPSVNLSRTLTEDICKQYGNVLAREGDHCEDDKEMKAGRRRGSLYVTGW